MNNFDICLDSLALGREYQQMNRNGFIVHFSKLNIAISAHTDKATSQFFNNVLIKYFSPVFL